MSLGEFRLFSSAGTCAGFELAFAVQRIGAARSGGKHLRRIPAPPLKAKNFDENIN